MWCTEREWSEITANVPPRTVIMPINHPLSISSAFPASKIISCHLSRITNGRVQIRLRANDTIGEDRPLPIPKVATVEQNQTLDHWHQSFERELGFNRRSTTTERKPTKLLWDDAANLFSNLSRAVGATETNHTARFQISGKREDSNQRTGPDDAVDPSASNLQQDSLPHLNNIPESRRESGDVEPFPSLGPSGTTSSHQFQPSSDDTRTNSLQPGRPSISRPARPALKAPTGPPPLPLGRSRSRAPSAAVPSPQLIEQTECVPPDEDPLSEGTYRVDSFSTISSEGEDNDIDGASVIGQHERTFSEQTREEEPLSLIPSIAVRFHQQRFTEKGPPTSISIESDHATLASPRQSVADTASIHSAVDNVATMVRKRASTINQRGQLPWNTSEVYKSASPQPKAKMKEPVLRMGPLYFSKAGRPVLVDGLVDAELLNLLDLHPVEGEPFAGYLTSLQDDYSTPTTVREEDHIQIARFTLGRYNEMLNVPIASADVSLADSNIAKVTESAGGKLVVKCATLPGLILLLTSEGNQTDMDYVVDFLRTYRYFADAADVSRLLVTRYIECAEAIFARALARVATSSTLNVNAGSGPLTSKSELDGSTQRVRLSIDSTTVTLPRGTPHGRQQSNGSNQEDSSSSSLRSRQASQLYGGTSTASLPLSTLLLNGSNGKRDDEWDAFTQLRVLNVFKKWLEIHPEDFMRNDDLAEIFLGFLDLLVAKDSKRGSFAESLKRRYVQRVTEIAPRYNLRAVTPDPKDATAPAETQAPAPILTAPPRLQSLTLPPLQPMSPLHFPFSPTGDKPKGHSPQPSTTESPSLASATTITATPSNDGSSPPPTRIPRPVMFRPRNNSQPNVKPSPTAVGTYSGFPGTHGLADMDPEDVAKQLCLIEQRTFFQIRVEELIAQRWNEKDKDKRAVEAPNLVELIAWFNHIAYGFASEVCRTQKLKRRVSLLKRLIFCAHNCVKFNNYNSAFEIVAGLNLSSVTRMQKTWAALPKKYTDVWASLNKLISNEENHRVYRTSIRTLRDKLGPDAPCLPYLGVFLADLTFAEDGNPTYLNEADRLAGTINFAKFALVSRIISQVEQFQKVSYDFRADDKMQKWLRYDMTVLDSAKLHETSRTIEPKQAG
ncbi:ras GEF [Gonapodya prolifera JEL478]|uniref:Ras GEF n=1 Tax=Gonapodya prolifera (strain JEL478) TaxID=1344416 RepID=A0A139AUC3_GONPJ|nr:ras GEF [Gonapodya prolifera JEL478]|eukprot:KXS20307.1 ras GEF [Gonapodya prolifera JEL478]